MSPTLRSSCCCVAIFLLSGDHDSDVAALVVHPALLRRLPGFLPSGEKASLGREPLR
jgi:hypothetical protein